MCFYGYILDLVFLCSGRWSLVAMKKNCAVHLKQNTMPKDKFGAKAKQEPLDHTTEHQVIVSRTTGRKHEIAFGPQSGGLVPSNPFASTSQQKYMYAHPSILGKKGLKEWSSKTDFSKLPKKVKK
jgi:hypothetical protein